MKLGWICICIDITTVSGVESPPKKKTGNSHRMKLVAHKKKKSGSFFWATSFTWSNFPWLQHDESRKNRAKTAPRFRSHGKKWNLNLRFCRIAASCRLPNMPRCEWSVSPGFTHTCNSGWGFKCIDLYDRLDIVFLLRWFTQMQSTTIEFWEITKRVLCEFGAVRSRLECDRV